MLRTGRAAALVGGTLALQLLVLGDGVVCADSMMHAARMSGAPTAMAGMDMSMSTDGLDAGAPVVPASERTTPGKAPQAPRDLPPCCKMFAPCAPSFVAGHAAIELSAPVHGARVFVLAERTPPSAARSPEPPPPRA